MLAMALVLVLAAPQASTLKLIAAQRFDEAANELLARRGTASWDMDDQLTLAAVCLAKSDLPCAELLYRETLNPEPRSALAFFGLAEIARLRGERDLAQRNYRAYLESALPGRSAGYDQIAQERLQQVQQPPTVLALAQQNPPTMMELSFASGRWAALSFFPALLAGGLATAVITQISSEFTAASLVAGVSIGAAVFGGGVAYGLHREAQRHGHRGNALGAALAAVIAPIPIGVAGNFLLENSVDQGLVGPVLFLASLGAVAVVPAFVFGVDMQPIEQ